ncbi:3-oxoacyl-[acyl-carrier-protein] synthase-1/3-oxoacyl-[acyl-carrier-protein] synthase II [Desulfonatronum zhilinae]|nr:3-oxoacyl-[acyl-carrier-protein] synthase-1/3-oxoacyl-[acyl-carrier-protein] synthase II [Desulfonatronum zhilinae]
MSGSCPNHAANSPAPVAVTGMGCICAAGLNLEQSLETIFSGRRAPAPARRFQSSHPTAYPVFEVPEAFFAKDQNTRRTLTVRFALHAAREALEQAGLSTDRRQDLRIGVCIGTTVGGTLNSEEFYREYLQSLHPDMEPVRRYLRGNPASAIAREFGFRGPCQTVTNACSSGTDAIGIGAGWIRAGLCDVVVAGGADELCRVTYNGFASLKIMDPEPCRPFDRARRGLNLGEGAGIMILEAQPSGKEAGKGVLREILGRILGYGTACDAHHLTAPHPEGVGLKTALAEALRLSGLCADDIAFVNAHGTGTKDNDAVESKVLAEALPAVPLLSTKGATGHTLGAAGAIEAVLSLAFLRLGKVPASPGFSEPGEDIALSPLTITTNRDQPHALTQSLAFGGTNSVLALSR